MKVLGLVASGRKDGNTNTLVEQILNGAKSKGHETKKVFLTDLKILPVSDCAVCRAAKRCTSQDDFIPLAEEMLESDCVVFGSPLYWYGPSAQMKAFIDRWNCFMILDDARFRAKMKGKRCVLAVPHQSDSLLEPEPLFAIMQKTFDYMEMAYVGSIQTTARGRHDSRRNEATMKYAFELGTRLFEIEDIKKATGSVSFNFGKLATESEPKT